MKEFPAYLLQLGKDDLNNSEEVTILRFNNRYKTHVPRNSERDAYNMGRGLTSPIFHIDEPAFQANIEIALEAALPAGTAARQAAKSVGAPYGTILTTTAGKRDEKSGKYVYHLVHGAAPFTEKFYDCANAEEFERVVRMNSEGQRFRVNITMNHRQLGWTDQRLKEAIDETTLTGDAIQREFFNMWTTGTQTHPLPVDMLQRIRGSYVPPLYMEITKPYGYITNWYIPEEDIFERLSEGHYILGLDTSDASGGDAIGFYIDDAYTCDTIAVGNFNETNLLVFSNWICQILVTFKNITAIIERRSSGASILDNLLIMLPEQNEDPFRRLFNWVVNDSDIAPDRFNEIRNPMNRRSSDIYVRYKKQFGFATSATGATSRTELYSTTLREAAKRSGDKIKDKTLIDQIAGLETRNGRIDHPIGEHDDIVIGWLLCHWVRINGKNLSFYGIDSTLMYRGSIEEVKHTPQENARKIQQEKIRKRMEEVIAEMEKETDEFVMMKLEHELRLLDKQIILEAGQVYSLDELIRKVKDNKKNRFRRNNFSQLNQFESDHIDRYAMHQGVFSDAPLGQLPMRRF